MSEAVVRPAAGHTSARPDLLASLDPLLRAWLPRQRWFAGKGRPVTGFSLVAVTELLPAGLLHVLIRAEQPAVAESPPAADCYQLFLGIRRTLPPHLAAALIGHADTGPLAGSAVYEGLQDPRLASLLLERLRAPGRSGVLRFERAEGVELPGGLMPRTLGAEQSNSSLVYGDTYILKLFRRVTPGLNPDLELPLLLAREGSGRVPAPVAWFGAEPDGQFLSGLAGAESEETMTLGVLQPFLAGAEDGWELALRSLAKGDDFRTEAHALGRATAEVHAALAAAAPTVSLGPQQRELIADGMLERLRATAQDVPMLRPYVRSLAAAFDEVRRLPESDALFAQRVHGDLHLGQCLRPADGAWNIIDFEGEPARPLPERRRPQPAVRDVAGMLRSFDYAGRSHRPWAPAWAAGCRAAYCEGYVAGGGTDPSVHPALLRAYETDKAVYEVLYEARHRPDWLAVPMAAIRRLAGEADEHPEDN
ncbi:maltokinase N-terminal cap-like domain-containing protein [Streptomyces indicus]|uniref:Maltokinase n=1 Tax=Streptomyces indicus TaxID=417292 RepID=A0A1G8WBM9_9ACTN|nr:maltokinase [Streptomyces indicus]SDJ75624.1 maltokinase [Streptomyces indicus]